jgi:hypothetical protein
MIDIVLGRCTLQNISKIRIKFHWWNLILILLIYYIKQLYITPVWIVRAIISVARCIQVTEIY